MTNLPANEIESIGMARRIRVVTGSRLHFGLLDTIEPFGGVGVMLQDPVTEIVVTHSDRFASTGTAEARIHAIARRVARHAGLDRLPDCRVEVVRCPRSHYGLGSGTQIALATAEALCKFLNLNVESDTLAVQLADRGKRSAVGVHGYFRGGLLFESADSVARLNPLVQRLDVPPAWSVVVVAPDEPVETISGDREQRQFSSLAGASASESQQLRQQVVDGILPAVEHADFGKFADAVHAYNRASGQLFQAVQGGCYNGRPVSEVIGRLIDQGLRGVGQSSWGPGVFVWFESPDQARLWAERLPSGLRLITITQPSCQPRSLVQS